MKRFVFSLLMILVMAAGDMVYAQPVPVTVDNFRRAESDRYFAAVIKKDGFGKFEHNRGMIPIDAQTVIRVNQDALYSGAVFDLDAGPVTITLPDAGKRFMSLQIINEDHYTMGVYYDADTYTLSREHISTRYVLAVVRILIDPTKPGDIEEAHKLQDALVTTQQDMGRYEVPNWDTVSQDKVRQALLSLGAMLADSRGMFGRKEQVDPVRHLIGTAASWGDAPESDAIYLNITPNQNNGRVIYRTTLDHIPVDGFWSVSVYNAKGYFEKNKYNAYSVNNLTAKRNNDGRVVVQFGGCDGKIPNCLPVMKGWNYMVRLYRPRAEILSGEWTFPEAQPVGVVE